MAAPFPTALQRTSDERWVNLEVVARVHGRLVARVVEDAARAAVVHWTADARYGAHVERLMSAPPPAPGAGVHLTWPDDLLHDLDARVVGYTALRSRSGRTFPLGDYVDPAVRRTIAPLATRRHHLRVARNVATTVAALHHAGHGRIRGRQFRVDEHAGIVLVHADSLAADSSAAMRQDDDQRLGHLIARLVGGRPWPMRHEIARLLADVGNPDRPVPPAETWYHVLRDAEHDLPADAVASTPQVETRVATPADVRTILERTAEVVSSQSSGGSTRDAAAPVRLTPHPAPPAPERALPAIVPRAAAPPRRAAPVPSCGTRSEGATLAGGTAAVRVRTHPPGSDAVTRPRASSAEGEDRLSRGAFTAAFAVVVGGLASVAPFAAFVGTAIGICVLASARVGRRRSSLGSAQTVAITLSRIVPFATGGLAFGAFILLDLLLLLGLVMAIASQVFDYGPGFTLGWVLDLPDVPLLVRWFSFVIAAAAGAGIGGSVHDRLRQASGERMVTIPAMGLALVLTLLLTDAGVVWWPLPLVV